MNPLNRDPKTLKAQVRSFIKKIQKEMNEAGLDGILNTNITTHEGKSMVMVNFRPNGEHLSAPMAVIETEKIFKDEEKARDTITGQIFHTLKRLDKLAQQQMPQEVII